MNLNCYGGKTDLDSIGVGMGQMIIFSIRGDINTELGLISFIKWASGHLYPRSSLKSQWLKHY